VFGDASKPCRAAKIKVLSQKVEKFAKNSPKFGFWQYLSFSDLGDLRVRNLKKLGDLRPL
jgi:hypothetical protein